MNYPDPKSNPVCQCKDNPMKAFWCTTGHMLECHYPYDCQQAACSHLRKYDFTEQDIAHLEVEAQTASKNGALKPYTFDEFGNAVVQKTNVELGKKIATAINEVQNKRSEPATRHEDNVAEPTIDEQGGDLCTRCGNPIDHNDPHMYCSECA